MASWFAPGWQGKAIGAIGGAVLGDWAARRGASRDMRNQQRMYDYRINQGLAHGMTPYEMFTGGAGGAGGGTTGSAAVLGNQYSQAAQMFAAQNQQSRENSLDRLTSLAQTEMQTTAQRDVAELNNSTTQRGQDISADQFNRQLEFDVRQYEEIVIPQAAAVLSKTEEETNKLINEVATSEPKFVRMLKIMTMGIDNTIGLAVQNSLGVDVSDPEQVQKLSPQKRKQLITGLMLAKSRLAAEAAGVAQTAEEWLKAMETIAGINEYDPNADDSSMDGPVLGQRGDELPRSSAPYKSRFGSHHN